MPAPFDLVISGGTVHTPQGKIAGGQVRIRDGKIVSVEQGSDSPAHAHRHIDAAGLDVLPGAIDTHSHHRDPGFTHKEDITSATTAAALGGITTSITTSNIVEVGMRAEATAVADTTDQPPAPTGPIAPPGRINTVSANAVTGMSRCLVASSPSGRRKTLITTAPAQWVTADLASQAGLTPTATDLVTKVARSRTSTRTSRR